MQTPIDVIARHQQEMAEQAAAGERARVANVARFVEMYLTLGPDATKLDGNRHTSELEEARALAAARWFKLLAVEQQIIREEQQLASRPRSRPAQPGDELSPDRTVEQRNAEWLDATKYKQGALAELKEQTKRERAELEGFIVKKK